MLFSKRETFYQVSRVTGPTHNFLAIELATGSGEKHILIEDTPGFCIGHAKLIPEAITSAVVEGLMLANHAFNATYRATHIQYHMSDSLPEAIYGVMAFKIVEHLVSGREFAMEGNEDERQLWPSTTR
ncbi:MAG: hypothetical protein ACRYFS_03090 [Janthinobacterium lividum]